MNKIIKNNERIIIKNYKLLSYILIAIGVLLRILCLNKFPVGLNCDEASSAYDAFSILKTLCDRNGKFLPVYMVAWGSGQSALLAYMMIPFIKLFGLNIFAIRLPQAIISIITLFVFYKLVNLTVNNDKEKLFAILFFVFNPWHIMKSRWGLDCNLLPDFVLFAVYFLVKFYYEDKKYKTQNIIMAFVFLSISAYSYATSFLGLSIFCILLYIYGLRTKTLTYKQIVISIIVVLMITWPLILFILVNTFEMPDIALSFMTIPKLRINRMATESIFTSKHIMTSLFSSMANTIKLLVIQFDKLYWNGIKRIGMYYIYSFPIFLYGLVNYINDIIRKKRLSGNVDDIFAIWFIAGFVLCICLKNIYINKINFIIIPTIYFIIKGFYRLFKIKYIYFLSVALVVISFILFSFKYIDANIKKANNILISDINTTEYDCFVVDIEPALTYLDALEVNEIRLGGACAEPYIYVLFYLKEDPKEFRKNRKNMLSSKTQISTYKKWNFEPILELQKDNDVAYLLDSRNINLIDERDFKVTNFGKFIVVETKSN